MRCTLGTTICLAMGLLLSVGLTALTAQQPSPAKPAPELKILEPLIGNWSAKVKLWTDPAQPPSESDGTMKRKWILGGFFIQEEVSAKFLGTDFKGLGIMGYDQQKKKYTGAWGDTFSGSLMVADSTYDVGTKTFTTIVEETDPATGKKAKNRETLRIVDNDHEVQEMFKDIGGGKEFKMMEIQYNRVK